MRTLAFATAAALVAATATVAHARPDVRKLTCNAAKRLVARNGAIVMTTGRHTYRRFVSNRFKCLSGSDVTRRERVRTADRRGCPLFICEPFQEPFRFRRN